MQCLPGMCSQGNAHSKCSHVMAPDSQLLSIPPSSTRQKLMQCKLCHRLSSLTNPGADRLAHRRNRIRSISSLCPKVRNCLHISQSFAEQPTHHACMLVCSEHHCWSTQWARGGWFDSVHNSVNRHDSQTIMNELNEPQTIMNERTHCRL